MYVDPSLGQQGFANGQSLLADADRIVRLNNSIFAVSGAPVNVIVFALGGATDGTGGADHMACDFSNGGNIEVCASFGAPARVSSLFMAELSECAMNGQLCGLSTGEALSRWCAMITANNAMADFTTAPAWAQAGMPDYVDAIDPTDQDDISTGCGMAFLSWMLSRGATLPQIAQHMVALGDGGTLAAMFARVTGEPANMARSLFQAALQGVAITSDDPFNALAHATATA